MAAEQDYVVGLQGSDKQYVVRASSSEEAREKVNRYTGGSAPHYVRERGNDRTERFTRVPDDR